MVALWNNEPYDWKIEFIFDNSTNVMRKSSLKLSSVAERSTLQVDLGQSGDVNALIIKRGIASGINELRRIGARKVLVDSSELTRMMGTAALSALVIGARLALYEPPSFKSDKARDDSASSVLLYIQGSSPQESAAVDQANILSDSILLTRDMVNLPANKLTPKIMAGLITEHCDKHGIPYDVFDESFLAEYNMGAFLAVGSSSGNPPRLIILRYMGDPSRPNDITAIIGKALTFDTGGYNIKTGTGMKDMKCDMAGGAAAFAAVLALRRNNVRANVIAVIPASENRISRESFVPGDVLTTMSGRTVEVISTDAEGRLIMSDAMTYAIKHEHATRLIDIATLTGAAVQALGRKTAATMANNDSFYTDFLNAASACGEQYWRMPAFDEYYLMIEGQIADIKNAPEDGCGIMAAGLFMEHFSEGLPWIHIDIAGTAFVSKPGYEFQKAGGTGAGVETLYNLFARLV